MASPPGIPKRLINPEAEEWIAYGHAASLLGLRYQAVQRLVDLGHLTVRKLPGAHPRLLQKEVLDLRDKFTTTAKDDAPIPVSTKAGKAWDARKAAKVRLATSAGVKS